MKSSTEVRRVGALVVIALAVAASGGCGPDLTIDPAAAVPYTIDFAAQEASAHIANVGNEDAGRFLVYLEISDPASAVAARPESQASLDVAGLAAGATDTLTVPLADFSPRFGSGFDPTAINTGLLEVRIDAKSEVDETNEDNNYVSGVF